MLLEQNFGFGKNFGAEQKEVWVDVKEKLEVY
jgi:hypothetical protein